MKLDALFAVKDQKLISIDNTKTYNCADFVKIDDMSKLDAGAAADTIYLLEIPQSKVESEPEVYDEAFLAGLRDCLKALEEKNVFAVVKVIPKSAEIAGGDLQNDAVCNYVACCKHTARRIKDCTSVTGFAIPDEYCGGVEAKAAYYIDELYPKHKQYIFFVSQASYADAVSAESDGKENVCVM